MWKLSPPQDMFRIFYWHYTLNGLDWCDVCCFFYYYHISFYLIFNFSLFPTVFTFFRHLSHSQITLKTKNEPNISILLYLFPFNLVLVGFFFVLCFFFRTRPQLVVSHANLVFYCKCFQFVLNSLHWNVYHRGRVHSPSPNADLFGFSALILLV